MPSQTGFASGGSTPAQTLTAARALQTPPTANSTGGTHQLVRATHPAGTVMWDHDGHEFHMWTQAGVFVFRENSIIFPNGVELRGEDVGGVITG